MKNRGVGRGGGGARRTKETKKKEEEEAEERKFRKETKKFVGIPEKSKKISEKLGYVLLSIVYNRCEKKQNKERTEERREKKKRIKETDTHKHTRTYTEKTEKFVDVRCVFSL